ncbi:MAG: signal peptidase I [Candidatus Nomurabacteria bacterium]|jgi:signal peptidase I|nr:signal peptidase I [Candidatus Nomurabacteria bacterium]
MLKNSHQKAAPPVPGRDLPPLPMPPTAGSQPLLGSKKSAHPAAINQPTGTPTSAVPDVPLKKLPIAAPQPNKPHKIPSPLKDFFGIVLFVLVVVLLVWLINSLILRSYSVVGPSMEDTFFTGQRVIVNRLPVTAAHIKGQPWTPARGQIIVFANPNWSPGEEDQYIIKRVVGLPGEKITVSDCVLKVYNSQHPDGFNPYTNGFKWLSNPSDCVTGDNLNFTVPAGYIFVVGDHRNGNYSLDSRSGLGYIPLQDVIGPVMVRIWPLNKLTVF